MKRTTFTFLILIVVGFMSCRKSGIDQTIQQYDQTQIQSYIAANNITGMVADSSGSGIYYKIYNRVSGYDSLKYSDTLSMVYTIHSFDGKYSSNDTITNHYGGYLGHIESYGLASGLQYAIHNLLKYPGTMRVLIPSNLAYGINGSGTGSLSNVNSHIAGNQCLDYYVNIIPNDPKVQLAYDTLSIKKYMAANNISGYTQTESGLYYKLSTAGTGTDILSLASSFTATYSTVLFNSTIVDSYAVAGGYSFNYSDLSAGVREGLTHATTGSVISIFSPSYLAYGRAGETGVPAYSSLRYNFTILTISP